MELAQDKIDLIEKLIKSDKKFTNNEDLYDDFFNETCKRSLNIVQTLSADSLLETYLKKVAATSILNVLKNEGRVRRSREGFSPLEHVSLENNYSNIDVKYEIADIRETPEDLAVKKDILQCIYDTVCEVDEKFPDKNYFVLYNLRYKKGMTQQEIASAMNISQAEVSKRLFRLMDEVRQTLNWI